MRMLRILLQAGLTALLLTGPAACGPRSPRSEDGKEPAKTAPANLPEARETTDPAANNPQKGRQHKGRIITLTDSLLASGGTDTLRFGHLGSGEIAVLPFRIENASSKPLVILSTQRSCGCISLDHDAQPLAPGAVRTMKMTFDSRGEYGWQLKRMDLLFAGARKPLRIFVEADVE